MTHYPRLTKIPGEFTGIMHSLAPETRPVMSAPPRVEASTKFITTVQADFPDLTREQAQEVADYILNFAERFAAMDARPVIDEDGNGPQCSVCATIWPLCGHQHLSHHEWENQETGDQE